VSGSAVTEAALDAGAAREQIHARWPGRRLLATGYGGRRATHCCLGPSSASARGVGCRRHRLVLQGQELALPTPSYQIWGLCLSAALSSGVRRCRDLMVTVAEVVKTQEGGR
jgi:hypothetical protein